VTAGPHDIPDPYLAPLVLGAGARIEQLGGLSAAELLGTVEGGVDPIAFQSMREEALITAVADQLPPGAARQLNRTLLVIEPYSPSGGARSENRSARP
jgi:hypothetical protein